MTRISLEAEQMAAVGGSWLQERYHSGEGETVADFLSFESVHDINPFEVGGDHSREKTMFRRRMAVVDRMLELEPLFDRALIALSKSGSSSSMRSTTAMRLRNMVFSRE